VRHSDPSLHAVGDWEGRDGPRGVSHSGPFLGAEGEREGWGNRMSSLKRLHSDLGNLEYPLGKAQGWESGEGGGKEEGRG